MLQLNCLIITGRPKANGLTIFCYHYKKITIQLQPVHERKPDGGPPLYVPETEEAHVNHDCSFEYTLVMIILASGLYVVRRPAGVSHIFVNTSKGPIYLTAVFPLKKINHKQLSKKSFNNQRIYK